jgi:hypothetical protein
MIKPLERPVYLDRISSTWNLETDGTGCIRGSSRHQFISTGSFSEQDYGGHMHARTFGKTRTALLATGATNTMVWTNPSLPLNDWKQQDYDRMKRLKNKALRLSNCLILFHSIKFISTSPISL